MGDSALAISTLYATADRMFTAATTDVIAGAPGSSVHLSRLATLAQKISALHEHVCARRDALARVGSDEDDDSPAPLPWAGEPTPQVFVDGPRPALVEVVPGVSVQAMLLPDACTTRAAIRDCIRGPALCYVPSWGHFAVRLGPHILHGNAGAVFSPGERRPHGVKECTAALCRRDACTYYHPPDGTKTGPAHIRNFVAESFMYRARGLPHPARYGGRAIGDYRSLGEDLNAISPEAARLFLDQVGHDIVCAIALLDNRPDLAER